MTHQPSMAFGFPAFVCHGLTSRHRSVVTHLPLHPPNAPVLPYLMAPRHHCRAAMSTPALACRSPPCLTLPPQVPEEKEHCEATAKPPSAGNRHHTNVELPSSTHCHCHLPVWLSHRALPKHMVLPQKASFPTSAELSCFEVDAGAQCHQCSIRHGLIHHRH